jgi:hypothetical protein
MSQTIDFTFNAERHEYFVAGKPVPGCTGVLASGGLVPYAMVARDVLERRSELGREVHKACHLHNIGRLGSFDQAVKPHLEAWVYFKTHCKLFELIASEAQCVGWVDGMPFGMQLDCNAFIDGQDTMIEYKIGQAYPHHGVQLAGYAAGFPHERISTPFARFIARKRIVVELRDNGLPKVHRYEAKSDYQLFTSLLHVSAWKKQFRNVYEKENL